RLDTGKADTFTCGRIPHRKDDRRGGSVRRQGKPQGQPGCQRAKVADADEPVGVGEGGGDDDELLAVRRKPTNDADLSRGGDDEELVVERRKPTNDTDRSRSPMPMGTLKSVKVWMSRTTTTTGKKVSSAYGRRRRWMECFGESARSHDLFVLITDWPIEVGEGGDDDE
ncbi:hypothetical protein GW17_00057370, partial [Ensete ventricosum]